MEKKKTKTKFAKILLDIFVLQALFNNESQSCQLNSKCIPFDLPFYALNAQTSCVI